MTQGLKKRQIIVALLMAVMIISALDKTIFAFAGVQIIDELKLTPEQYGMVGSAFFLLYSLSGIMVGFLANRCPTRWILVGMSLVWMAAQAMVAFSSQLTTLIASRVLLGAGTGPATAVTQHAAFKWYKPSERMLPSSLIYTSIMIGSLIGALILPLAIERFGWRMAYLTLAAAGCLWMLLWLAFGCEGNQHSEVDTALPDTQAVAYRRLLLNRTFICLTLLAFFCYTPAALGFSWTIVYLKKGIGLQTEALSAYLLSMTTLAIVSGLMIPAFAQRAYKRGASVFRALVAPPLLCCVSGGAMLAMIAMSSQPGVKLALMFLATALLAALPSFSMTLIAYFTPTQQRGSLLAIHNAVQTSSGIVTPALVGQLIALSGNDIAHGFETAIASFGICTLAVALLGFVGINPHLTRQQILGAGDEGGQALADREQLAPSLGRS
ncbi:sugar phosphate permease [Pseudomonas sp. GM21]|jgi:MFS family permease|uniref:MFS transporter n=1 Tax=Pseudomonas sp. GM21 TaxID=1144325 RepID=UPI00027228F0|nr:MFS transporter [Pseudomonas sp. GM21]EJM21061.1 sugar phosphate permease [Pseudomonas sp. GM21]